MSLSFIRRRAGIVALLLPLAAPLLTAQHQPLADPEIQKLVEHELADKGIPGVTVQVRQGVVTLTGSVPSLWARQEAIEQAREVVDVQDVLSSLTIARGEGDQALGEAVAEKIRRYVFYTIFDDINIEVEAGVVTLSGRVTMPYKAEEMVALASRVHYVQEVRNGIQALPVSLFDDQLRAAIARAIYRDPLFWNYAIQVNPPVHIIVEHGRVTLTGVVLSEVERRKAEVIARSTFGVFSVENKLRLESES